MRVAGERGGGPPHLTEHSSGPNCCGPLNSGVRRRGWPKPRRDGTPLSRAVAATFGGLVGGGLLGGISYTHGSDVALGAIAGVALVGVLGYGVEAGTMSPVTLCAVLFALFFCMIGPGCDDYGGIAAIPAALFGALIGRLFFRCGAVLPNVAIQRTR